MRAFHIGTAQSLVMKWLAILLLPCILAASRTKRQSSRGPLYDYVYTPDPVYKWNFMQSADQDGFTTFYLNLTSQQWYDSTLSNRPIWWHYLVIHIPDNIQYTDAALLYISSGSNTNSLPSLSNFHVAGTGEIANSSKMVTAVLRLVPNQPIIFEDDGKERTEDEIIAWTWRRFYNESSVGIDNPQILLRMPMCKAAVRAMDAVTEFVDVMRGNVISKFMVAGESKRGWTTWLTGGIDDRVVALAPVVLSCLNMVPNFHHYYRSFGGWPYAMFDYFVQGVMGLIDTPEMLEMAAIIDPYSYIDYLTMPKLMISGASDEFFMPDDYNYFYSDLLGEKHIWLMENTGHSMSNGALVDYYWTMIETFYTGVLQNYEAPNMGWTKETTSTGGSITLLASQTPSSVIAYSAPSVDIDRRDFRLSKLDGIQVVPTDIVWDPKSVENLGGGAFRVQYDNPAEGYLAFFIKATFTGPNGRQYIFTTDAHIIPGTWPYADCSGSECNGSLK